MNREDLLTARQEEWQKLKTALFRNIAAKDDSIPPITDDMQYALYLKLVRKMLEI